jgi:hypothetical protein
MTWSLNRGVRTAAFAALIASIAVPSLAQRPATTAPSTPPAAAPAAPATEGRFSTEAAAKAHCPTDTVVWVNTNSKVYHFAGTRDYGHTKAGTYMCEKDTAGAGFLAAKNEKHP